jgi:hypothetical protein
MACPKRIVMLATGPTTAALRRGDPRRVADGGLLVRLRRDVSATDLVCVFNELHDDIERVKASRDRGAPAA